MATEEAVVYEKKDPEEPALIVQIKSFEDLNQAKLKQIIESIGLSSEELKRLLSLDLTNSDGSDRFPVFNQGGEKIEDVISKRVNTLAGEVEVADVKLYPTVVKEKDNTSLHLKIGKNKGFEIIYVTSGNARLSFPNQVAPVATDVYSASQERSEINLTPGMLAIIPAPTANGWTDVGSNFSFRYVCQPKWSADFVKTAVDLN